MGIVRIVDLQLTGDNTFTYDLRRMGACAFMYEEHNGGTIALDIALDRGDGTIDNYVVNSQGDASGGTTYNNRFGFNVIAKRIQFHINCSGYPTWRGAIAFFNEPIKPFGSCHLAEHVGSGLAAGANDIAMSFRNTGQGLGYTAMVMANKAFAVRCYIQGFARNIDNQIAQVTNAAGGIAITPLIPSSQQSRILVYNNDGAAGMDYTMIVRHWWENPGPIAAGIANFAA